MIYQRILHEYNTLCDRICCIQKQLRTLPDGKLICSHQPRSTKWYVSNGHQKTYIPKSNRPFAEQLAQKKYLSLLLEDLENEKKALAFYLRHHAPTDKSAQLLTEPSEYQKLLAPYFTPLSQELADWMNSPYEKNTNHSDNLIFNCTSNTCLRSKSEVVIDMILHSHNIPHRYECALHLGQTIIYPDFTIRHPQTGAFYYWEHFGLMDNPDYIENTASKIKLYADHGIIPGIRLITTYETKNYPLNPEIVEKYIEYHFMPKATT